MQRQRRTGTGPEMALRKVVWARGLRYRVNAQLPLNSVRRRADLLFPKTRVAVFVDGCFWHGCPLHGTLPKANASWWQEKLESNTARDRDTDRLLEEVGWRVVRVWEHETVETAADRIQHEVRGVSADRVVHPSRDR